MLRQYIKQISFGFVIISLLSVNGFYFLLTGQDFSDASPFKTRIDLSVTIPNQPVAYLTLTPEEKEDSVSTYDHWIKAACRKYSLDPALVKAVIHAESRFDPLAVSPRGAAGLMQLGPGTARELGVKDPFNPKHNIDGGVQYLKDLLNTFNGDKKLALAAYNAGPTQVYRHNGVPPFKDTKKYIKQVIRYTVYYQQNRKG
jgi:soluble lytic murein transglycosylase-like protein